MIMSVKNVLGKFVKSRVFYYFLIFVYRFFLDWNYRSIIVPYYGQVYDYSLNLTIEFTIVSWLILIVFSIWTERYYYENNGVTYSVIVVLFFISVVPFTTLIQYGQFPYKYIWLNTTYWFMLYFAVELMKHIKMKKIIIKNSGRWNHDFLINLIWIICSVLVIYLCAIYSNFRISFSLNKVYDLRRESLLYKVPTILRYLYTWATWINPFLIAYFIRKKKYINVAICSIIQILMFGYDGMKGPFFFAVVVVLINTLLPKMKMSSLNCLALYGVTGASLFADLLYKINGNYVVSNLFFNRLCFIPNVISNAYYSFFSNHTPDYFRSSFLRFFGAISPYGDIPHTISMYYFGFDMGANNGLISDALTNLGVPGIFIMPFVLAVTLKIIDLYTDNLDRRILMPLAIYLVIMIMSMFYLPILLTGGLIAIVCLLNIMNKSGCTEQEKTHG